MEWSIEKAIQTLNDFNHIVCCISIRPHRYMLLCPYDEIDLDLTKEEIIEAAKFILACN